MKATPNVASAIQTEIEEKSVRDDDITNLPYYLVFYKTQIYNGETSPTLGYFAV